MTAQTQTPQATTVARFAKSYGMYLLQQTQQDLTAAALKLANSRHEVIGTHLGLFGDEPLFSPATLREVFSDHLRQE